MHYKAASDWPRWCGQVADGHELFDGGANYVGISQRRRCAPSRYSQYLRVRMRDGHEAVSLAEFTMVPIFYWVRASVMAN